MKDWTVPLQALVRASLLFIPALVIFLLRIAQIQFNPRLTTSPVDTFVQTLVNYKTYQTVVFYLFSAWVMMEVFVWTAPYEADLAVVAVGQ